MQFLEGLVNKDVFIYLRGGGVLKGKLQSCAEDHVVVHGEAPKRGGETIPVDRFVAKNAIQWVEENRGQRAD